MLLLILLLINLLIIWKYTILRVNLPEKYKGIKISELLKKDFIDTIREDYEKKYLLKLKKVNFYKNIASITFPLLFLGIAALFKFVYA